MGNGMIGVSETADEGFNENFSVVAEGDVVSRHPPTSRAHVNVARAEQRDAEDEARTALLPALMWLLSAVPDCGASEIS